MSGMLPSAGAPDGSGAEGAALPDAGGEGGKGSARGTDPQAQLADMPEVHCSSAPGSSCSGCRTD
jgi:hypothetical protein